MPRRTRSEQRLADVGHQLVSLSLRECAEQAAFVAEVSVEDRLGDAGLSGNCRHRHIGAAFLDDAGSSVEQLGASFGAALRCWARRRHVGPVTYRGRR